MKISLLVIGKIKEKWMRMGIGEYEKRLKPFLKMELIEHEEEKMPGNPSSAIKEQIMEKEGDKLLKAVSDSDCVILLDTEGTAFSSEELAAWLQNKMVQGTSHFYFMIGGPYGNGENIKKREDLKISIGSMTFTHQMARLILFEQLYRAMKINRHEPYHL